MKSLPLFHLTQPNFFFFCLFNVNRSSKNEIPRLVLPVYFLKFNFKDKQYIFMERVNLWSTCPYSPSSSLTEMCYLKNIKLLELLNITFKLIYYSYLQTSVRQFEIKDFCLYTDQHMQVKDVLLLILYLIRELCCTQYAGHLRKLLSSISGNCSL